MRQHPLLAFATAVSTIPLTLFGALGNAGAASTKHLSEHAARATSSAPLHRVRSHKRARPKHARPHANTTVHTRSTVVSTDVMVKGAITRHVFVPLGGVWSALRNCESGGNYATDTGNGFYGAYQFALTTWHDLRLNGLPSSASPAVQDAAAKRLQQTEGWRPWPNCSWALGLAT